MGRRIPDHRAAVDARYCVFLGFAAVELVSAFERTRGIARRNRRRVQARGVWAKLPIVDDAGPRGFAAMATQAGPA
jgi:hypothetical protein